MGDGKRMCGDVRSGHSCDTSVFLSCLVPLNELDTPRLRLRVVLITLYSSSFNVYGGGCGSLCESRGSYWGSKGARCEVLVVAFSMVTMAPKVISLIRGILSE
jgi:hypothetical protein